jgi:hypothetical protein
MFLSLIHHGTPGIVGSKLRGVHVAIVVHNGDGESNPGYRVKVMLPLLSEQDATFWARIAVPMAGPSRGTYVLPEIDDQVLVVFEHGDINRPIVIGTVWSRKQEPVEVNQSGKNNTKLIKSRSGHRIIFDDNEGAEKIVIVDKTRRNKIVLDASNKLVKIESDGDIDVIAKANVIIHSNALKIGASEGVNGKGRSLLTHSAMTFSLKATSGITIGGGNTTINVMNGPAASVSGSGAGEVGGAGSEPAGEQVRDRRHRRDGGNVDHSPARGATAPVSGSPGGARSCPTDFLVVPASLTLGVDESSVLRASDIQPEGRGAGAFTWQTTSTKLALDGANESPQVISGPRLSIRAGSESATSELIEVTRTQPSCAPLTKQVRIAIVCERFRLTQPKIVATATDVTLRPTTTVSDPALFGGYPLGFGQDLSFSMGRPQPFGPSVGTTIWMLQTRMRELLPVFASSDTTGKATRLFNTFLSQQGAVSFWSDPDLTAAAEAHSNIQAWVDRALSVPGTLGGSTGRRRIHQALQEASWDINAVVAPTDLGVPAFNKGNPYIQTGDYGNGLTVMANGIQHAVVVAKAYSYNACRHEYTIRLEFLFYDVFGLDDDDLREFGADGGLADTHVAEGFTAWWQLQHQHGYAPLITRIAFEREFTISTR